MNFITYINELGTLKVKDLDYNEQTKFFKTVTTINESYLVTSVFIGGFKSFVSISDYLQMAVINDNNFDSSVLDSNSFSNQGTFFEGIHIIKKCCSSTSIISGDVENPPLNPPLETSNYNVFGGTLENQNVILNYFKSNIAIFAGVDYLTLEDLKTYNFYTFNSLGFMNISPTTYSLMGTVISPDGGGYVVIAKGLPDVVSSEIYSLSQQTGIDVVSILNDVNPPVITL